MTLRAQARSVLPRFGWKDARLRPLRLLHNAVYRVDVPEGGPFVLRIARPGYRTKVQLDSELEWLEALGHDTQLLVPEPIRTTEGERVVETEAGRFVTVFSWVPGITRRRRSLMVTHARRIGELQARLHNHAEGFDPPGGFERPRFYRGGLFETGGTISEVGWGRLDDGQRAILRRMADRTSDVLDELPGSATHLVHADLGVGNVRFHERRAGAIDFDDCGFGHFAFDLAYTAFSLRVPELRDALFAGYRSVRDLPDVYLDALPVLELGARVPIVLWLSALRDEPRFRDWAPDALGEFLGLMAGI